MDFLRDAQQRALFSGNLPRDIKAVAGGGEVEDQAFDLLFFPGVSAGGKGRDTGGKHAEAQHLEGISPIDGAIDIHTGFNFYKSSVFHLKRHNTFLPIINQFRR